MEEDDFQLPSLNDSPSPAAASASVAPDIAVASKPSTSAGSPSHWKDQPRVRSCAPCRLRRVKCDRPPGGESMACLKCVKKGIQCTEMPKSGKRVITRSGPRLELAKAMYGGLVKGKAVEKDFDTAALASSLLRPSGPSSALVNSELEGSLTSALMEEYMTITAEPLVAAASLIASFEKYGRQMSSLDEHGQLLCSTIVAVMARSSAHPLIIGSTNLSHANLPSVTAGDLSEYGHKRLSACEILTDRAVNLVDATGILRKPPSLQSVAALLLLEQLSEPHTIEGKRSTASRPYSTAYISHVRLLMQMDLPALGSLSPGNVLAHTSMLRDAVGSFVNGISPTFSEDDHLELRGGDIARLAPLSTVLSLPRLPDPSASVWLLFDSYLFNVSRIGYTASRHLTGSRASRAPKLDLNFCSTLLADLEIAANATGELLERALLFIDYAKEHLCRFELQWVDRDTPFLWRHIRSLRLCRCMEALALYRLVHARQIAHLQQKMTIVPSRIVEVGVAASPPAVVEDEYGQQLEAVHTRSFLAVFQSARELVALLDDAHALGEHTAGSSWLDAQAQEYLYSSVPEFAGFLIDMPAQEEGGQDGYSFQTKLASLRTLERAVSAIGWSYPHFTEPLPWIKENIAKVELAQALHYQKSANVGPALTLTDPSFLFSGDFGGFALDPTLDFGQFAEFGVV